MEIRFTVLDPGRGGAAADVVVRAAGGTPFAAVRDEVCAAVGAASGAVSCSGRAVADEAPLGLPPLLEGAVLTVGAPRAGPEAALLEAHVVAGPDAGLVVPVPPGEWTVGRAAEAAVRIGDPDVSRVHAVLLVAAGGVTVADAGSSNGTFVAGERVGEEPVPVPVNAVLRIGGSSMTVRAPGARPAAVRPDGVGGLVVNRPPRLVEPAGAVTVRRPDPPRPRRETRLPWPAMLLPLLLSVPLAVLWRQPAFLVLALMTPLLMLGQFVADRRGGRREAREEAQRYAEALALADERVAEATALDAARREAGAPDLALLDGVARGPTERLWERCPGDEDALLLRIGRGSVPAAVVVRERDDEGVVEHRPVHEDVPVTVDLGAVPVLGIAAPRAEALGVARSLLGQLAVLRSPRDLRIDVVAPEADWRWTRWLPHASVEADGGHRVIVVDGAAGLRERPDVAALLEQAADGNVSVLWVADGTSRLPVECRAALVAEGPGRWVLRVDGEQPVGDVRPDLAGPRWANRLARSLAPLRDPEPARSALPASVRLLDLVREVHAEDAANPEALRRLWAHGGGRLAPAPVGVAAGAPYVVDLPRDGPHALVAGTTGAGKSELLQTLVAGLAAANPPDVVTFLLVDYKGGTSFGGCAELPHVAALVTDLDEHLGKRALTSLAAELRRREALLRAAGAADVEQYATLRAAGGSEALPRLVVVVDEFRALAEELPDFVGGLVRTATLGRSLGVHLVLATQRPAGVVSAEIRANSGLRIALRVQDRADSLDVVDVPDAALLPSALPGRAVLRAGSGTPVTLQVARVAGVDAAAVRPSVTVLGAPAQSARETVPGGGPGDLARLVAASRTAAAGCPPPRPPWCPPLPRELEAAALADGEGGELVFGLADHLEAQRQPVAVWAVGTHLAVAGGPRSGRSTALRTLAGAAGRAGMHVHGVDGGHGLAALSGDGHVGAVAAAADHERCDRLLSRLAEEIARRRGSASGPEIVLLLDGWEAIADAWAGVEHGRLVDDALRVLRDGLAVGVRAAVSGGRAVLTGAPSTLLAQRLVLRFADPQDAVLAGVPSAAVPRHAPAGRGVLVGPGPPREVQVARASTAPARLPPGRRPWRVPALPPDVDVAGLLPGGDERLPVGVRVDGEGLVPATLTPGSAAPVVVLGPAGSGRSTALATLARAAASAGRPAVLVTADHRSLTGRAPALRHPPLDDDDPRIDPWAAEAADRVLRRAREPGAVLLVDDAADLPPPVAEAVSGLAGTVPTVLVANAGQVVTAYSGPLAAARSARTGLLLGAIGPGDGEALGVRLGVSPAGPPGRGRLVVGGRSWAVQVAR